MQLLSPGCPCLHRSLGGHCYPAGLKNTFKCSPYSIRYVLNPCHQVARAYTDRWVGIWFSDSLNAGIVPGWFYLGIYLVLGLGYALLTFLRSIDFRYMW